MMETKLLCPKSHTSWDLSILDKAVQVRKSQSTEFTFMRTHQTIGNFAELEQ
jgi:hypothetical protein